MKRENKRLNINLPNGDKLLLDLKDIPTFIPNQMLVELAIGYYHKGEQAS